MYGYFLLGQRDVDVDDSIYKYCRIKKIRAPPPFFVIRIKKKDRRTIENQFLLLFIFDINVSSVTIE